MTLAFKKTNFPKYWQFFKYCVGGATAFMVDFSLLYALTDIFQLWYIWSATFSFIIAAFVNYAIQRYWTFKSFQTKATRQFIHFLLVQIVGLIINNSTMYLLVEAFGIWYLLAKALAAIIVLVWNFIISKKIVFGDKKNNNCLILAAEIFPPDIGGPATYSYRLAKYLIHHHHQIKIICYSAVQRADYQEEFGWRVTRVSSYSPLIWKYFLYFLKLFKLAIKADAIFAQGPVASGFASCLVSKILDKKLIIKVVGNYAWEQARMYHATEKNIDDWQKYVEFNHRRWFINWKLKFINRLQTWSVRAADAVIVPSYYLKKVVTAWGVDPAKIKVVYNSVEFNPAGKISQAVAKEKINQSGDLIITGGRLMPWKGFAMLIEIMPQIKKINPHFKLLIFGSGPEEGRLKELAQKNNLENDIIFTGPVAHEELYAHYSASSIFALNSSYEGLSHIILDAMYYNLPIIVANAGGNGELISDDYNGLLVTYNNKRQWLEAISKIWSNDKLRRRLCEKPLVKMDVFSFEHMIKETLKIIF